MSIALGSTTLSCVNDGTNGRGIQSTVVEYCAGASPTVSPGRILVGANGVPYSNTQNGIPLSDGLWTPTIPVVPAGWYLWTRTKITYDDGTTSEAFNVGKEGATIALEERQYYLSDSYVTLHGGSWSTAQPYPIPEGYYLWGRMKLTMTDGTVKYSSAVYENTLSGVMNKTSELDGYIQQKIWQTDIFAAINDYDTLEGNVTIRDRISEYYQDLEGIHTTIGDTITSDDSIISNLSKTTQTANKINWIVSSGTSAANMQLTQDALTVIANNINLTGKVSFNSFDEATKSSFNTTASAATNADDLSKKLKNVVATWVDDPTLATTYINGGYIQTHTIEAKNLATDAIKSFGTKGSGSTYTGAYLRAKNNVYSTTGSLLDLQYGNIFTPSFSIINTVPSGESLTAGAYFNGHVTAKTLTVGTSSTINIQQGTLQEGAAGIVMNNGSLQASNAVIYGTIYASLGKIGGWTIGSDILYYSSNTPSSTSMILKPGGVTSSTAIGGSTGSNTWAFTIKNVFGVRTDGYMFTSKGKIGGFTIDASKLYNNISEVTGTTDGTKEGVYLGLNGFANYKNSNTYVRITQGKITAFGAEIHGNINATTGTIGDLTLASGAIYYNADSITSTEEGWYLGTSGFRNYKSNDKQVTIANGVITAKGANITGTINATAGYIGTKPGNTDYRIFIGDRQVNQSTLVPCIYWNITSPSDTTHTSGFYLGYDGIRLGSGFKADSSGNVFVNAAYIGTSSTVENRIYIGNTTVNGDAASPCIRYKITSFSDTTHTAGFYLGSDGLRIGKVYVGSDGATNIQSGAVIGSVTANHFTINSGTQTTDKSSMYYNKSSLDSNTSGIYLGTDGIALGAKTSSMTHSPFYVDSNGNLYATSATITGTITAGANSKIGPWNITDTSIYKGSNTPGTAGNTNAYFGNSGLSISDNFIVSNTGALTAKSANISGVLTSGDGSSIGSWSVTNGILQNSDASIQLAPSAIASLDIIYPGGISRPTYIKAGEGGATRIGQGAIKTEYCLADAYGIQGKNAIRTSDVTGNIMFGNAPLIVIDKTNKDILIDAIDGEDIARNNALRYNLVANGVRGFNVVSNTDFTLLQNRLYLVIFFHASTSSYCGMYLIRGGQTQKYAISTASSITITYPDADHKTTFRWTSSSNPICRIEMLQ